MKKILLVLLLMIIPLSIKAEGSVYNPYTKSFQTSECITTDQYEVLVNQLNIQTFETGILALGICIYVMYRVKKINKIELNTEDPKSPPIKSLVIGIVLITIEIILLIRSGGSIDFGNVQNIGDVLGLLAYLAGYYIFLITGIVLVVSYVKRERYYRSKR